MGLLTLKGLWGYASCETAAASCRGKSTDCRKLQLSPHCLHALLDGAKTATSERRADFSKNRFARGISRAGEA